MSSSIGKIFCVTTFGESHGISVGAVVDGCPSGLELSEEVIQAQLDRRRPGASALTTQRRESDKVRILSGVQNGVTLGTPVSMVVDNSDKRPSDYEQLAKIPRPSHADATYRAKYGIAAASGGGRASARETVGRVAAGAVADKFIKDRHNIDVTAWVSSVGTVDLDDGFETNPLSRADVDKSDVRCPDPETAIRMTDVIKDAMSQGDSVGGVITCVCRNVPVGLGEPVFGKMEANLAAAMLSIPAVKGFEVGSGFNGSRMRGSAHNDMFVMKNGSLGTLTNRSGGISGGITNGEPVVFRVAFKPTATIKCAQETVDYDGNAVTLKMEKGRHDPCVLPRAVPIVESMAAMILADMLLIARI